MLWLASLALSCAVGARAVEEAAPLAPAVRPAIGLSVSAPVLPAGAPVLTDVPVLPGAEAVVPEAPLAQPVSAAAVAARPAAQAVERQLAVLGHEAAQASERGASASQASANLSASYDKESPKNDGSEEAPIPVSAGSDQAGLETSSRHEPPKPPAPPRPSGVKRYLGFLPNLLTGLNMTSGLASVMALMHGAPLPVVGGLIVLANVFDAFDGRAARWLGNHDPTGIDADSLADIVSFGVAPALLVYKAALSGLGLAALVPAALFVAGGWWRLKRFNVGARVEASGAKPKAGFFTGLPIPGGAGVIVAFVLALPVLAGVLSPLALTAVAAGVTLATASAMVSTLPYPNFKLGGSKALLVPALVGAVVAGGLALAHMPLLIPAGIFGAYLTTGPIIGLLRGSSEAFRRELNRKLFHVVGLVYIPILHAFRVHALAAMSVFVVLTGLSEWARVKLPAAKPLFDKVFGGIIREKEAHRPSAFFYAALGILASLALFGAHSIFLKAGIAALFLCDPISPLIGMRFPVGYYKVRGVTRSWPGSLAAFAAAFAVAFSLGFSPWIALGAAAAFSAVDILPVKPDDNFWIPVVFSAALFLLSHL